ncbi:DUF2069 domain-containing protein [Venatoribacter cucullus]|uniref:DUF2069 domain-containing protein n=1 Tax=Venatoribacter cucullus TaxID=2661630 RepID=A0A9E8FK37_9GAMM|nr:DUF2069 domain-containing protein [Venatoribacter cucullus]QQD21042.1 DUF2069 domain-containing protein [Oceanospirillaceae bacterium ASx5O]QQD23825.1 DUF2069 domain-containing protein [Venatoribacter cucullus]UZK03219.1 DUF2069 domain-containing protein [Venatoribacter cucullus]
MITKVNTARWIMLSSYTALLLLLVLQTLLNPPAAESLGTLQIWIAGAILALFKILPLLLFVRGLSAGRHTTAAWLAYMAMLYFVFGVLLTFTPGASGWGWGVSISSLVLIIAAMLYTRWKKAA